MSEVSPGVQDVVKAYQLGIEQGRYIIQSYFWGVFYSSALLAYRKKENFRDDLISYIG